MAIFPAGKSTAINSPRYLTLRYARRAAKLRALAAKKDLAAARSPIDDGSGIGVQDDEDNLQPGQEKLNSYWSPSLKAGPEYVVSVSQEINANNGDPELNLNAKQTFFVDSPQFVLPEGSVLSVYPPPAYNEDRRILPHVVLTDPHLPWERVGSSKAAVPDNHNQPSRNQVPWLVLLSFTQEELRLTGDALDRKNGIFRETKDLFKSEEQIAKQTSTLAVNMTVADVLRTLDTRTPVDLIDAKGELDDVKKALRADFIFLKRELFTSLFSQFDECNEPVIGEYPDTAQYQYLSHVRKINTAGMAIAGVEEVGVFSIVIGRRSGPLDRNTPTSIAVHLVSIEEVENMQYPINEPYIGLCSLYSWNYTVMPPGQLNVHDAFVSIGRTLGTLRPPDTLLDSLPNVDGAQARLIDRLKDGFALLKYRTQTGESTVAMYRGPFTPTIVPDLEVNETSNSGVDLQILDKEVGVLDITYSSAWQLGRTLALGDQAFTAALSRLRTAIRQSALKNSKLDVLKSKSPNSIRTRTDVLSDLAGMMENLSKIHATMLSDGNGESPDFAPGGPMKRWFRRRLQPSEFPNLAFNTEAISRRYPHYAHEASVELAMAADGSVFDETNVPVSTDWMIVLAWVLNRMFLVGVPAHYLITDPSHLEQERLQFFYIDPNWVDAMIDGALSLGNHMPIDEDRIEIKKRINDYINNPIGGGDEKPQIPTYGFYLRSDLVTMFPDLKVTTLPEELQAPNRAPLLRHEIVGDGVMLCLLDRKPGAEDFTGLRFTQPPHQQRFAAAARLDADSIEVKIRAQFTVDEATRKDSSLRGKTLPVEGLPTKPADRDNIFIWGSTPEPGKTDLHVLRLPRFPELQLKALQDGMTIKYFDDDAATSALFALQLNDPVYTFSISLRSSEAAANLASLSLPPFHTAQSAPRILRRTNLRRFKTAITEPDPPSEDDEDGAIDVEPGQLPSLENYLHPKSAFPPNTPWAGLAPHIRPIPLVVNSTPSQQLSSISATEAPEFGSLPTFNVEVFSNVTFDADVERSVYSDVEGLPQDLVISVLPQNTRFSDYKIKEFVISFRLGNAEDKKAKCLFPNYNGPGPFMLSNLRFNALTSLNKDENGVDFLQVRLLPRSAEGSIEIEKVTEMSAMLTLAIPNVFDKRVTTVLAYTRAYFANNEKYYDYPPTYIGVVNTKITGS